MPCKILCLASLIVAQALADNAFEVPFDSMETLLSRPKLEEHVQYLPLKWRAEVMDDYIMPITYDQFVSIWNRTLFVTGVRDMIRPYAVRVGAGGRIDRTSALQIQVLIASSSSPSLMIFTIAVLSPALRNYVLSNT